MSGSVKIFQSFQITGRGFITELQHLELGLPSDTRLVSSEQATVWLVKKRVLSDTLLLADAEIYFDCETNYEHITQSYDNETDRQTAINQELEKRRKGIYWYLLVPENPRQTAKPEIGSLLTIIF